MSRARLGLTLRRVLLPGPGAIYGRSLYLAVVFGALFLVMLIAQMTSVINSDTNYLYGQEALTSDQGTSGPWSNVWRPFVGQQNGPGYGLANDKDNWLNEADKANVLTAPNGQPGLSNVDMTDDQLYGGPLDRTPTDHWQPVVGSRGKFFIFSAYYDGRNSKYKYIRIIAATLTRRPDKVQCVLNYTNQNGGPVTVNAVNRVIRENWNLKYSAYFVLCLLGHNSIPDTVSVVVKDSWTLGSKEPSQMANVLTVRNVPVKGSPPQGAPKEPSFAVCVKPLHYDYNQVVRLAEFFELNRLLGVGHFVFYNHTVGPDVGCLLRKYIDQSLVTLLPWKLDIPSQKEIRTEGLFAALNDCLYRTMYKFDYVLLVDLDEYVIPHEPSLGDLRHLVARVASLNNNDAKSGAYSFQNAFYYLQWPDDPYSNSSQLAAPTSETAPKVNLLTLSKTRRKKQLHMHKQRSKYIVRPQHVIEVGNHFVWEFVAGRSMVNVAPRFGYLHHYRICEFGGDECINTESLVDHHIGDTWGKGLLDHVNQTLAVFKNGCPVIKDGSNS
ncbi:hypothetical protein HDE_02157 [Halotydeus destructor]|nr:hypothetical protein HDE_02157 [Halotydeus destructor]